MTEYNHSVTIDGASGDLLPTPQDIRLKSSDDVRLEMARVYRDMRQGRIDASDGTKLVYVLTAINKAIETGLLESRMNALERTLKEKSP